MKEAIFENIKMLDLVLITTSAAATATLLIQTLVRSIQTSLTTKVRGSLPVFVASVSWNG
jgi:hypothetical protein